MRKLKRHSSHKVLHYILLALCLSILAAVFTAAYIDPVFSFVTHDPPGYGICIFKNITGYDCPGCGLTRSFLCIARGDFARSFHYHDFGIVLFAYLCLQTIIQGLYLIFGPVKYISFTGRLLGRTGLILLFALYFSWIIKFINNFFGFF
ncbi:MAG: DUF2752 domain-containing protein [Desulfobacteraceae bacterium]|jgi:hypothetical protein